MGQQHTPAVAPAVLLDTLRLTGPLRRIGGGFETDVFRSGDGCYAVKFKQSGGSQSAMLARARRLALTSRLFCAYLGPENTLTSDYLLVADAQGLSHVVTIQPFLEGARALDALEPGQLGAAERRSLLSQLKAIAERALACYGATGLLPDLYGLSSHDSAQARSLDPRWLMREGARIVLGRPLLRAHNLMLSIDGRVVLVDYDPLCSGSPLCGLVYGARATLLGRDLLQLAALGAP